MIKTLSQKMERLFENSIKKELISIEELKKTFTLNADPQSLTHLSYVFSGPVGRDQLSLFFSQLASFFEMGFLFERSNSGRHHAMKMFAYSLQIENLEGLPLIKLPTTELFKVLQTESKSFLSKLGLSELNNEKKLRAFLIRISPTCTLVLLLSLADPWARVQIEALQETLMKIHFE